MLLPAALAILGTVVLLADISLWRSIASPAPGWVQKSGRVVATESRLIGAEGIPQKWGTIEYTTDEQESSVRRFDGPIADSTKVGDEIPVAYKSADPAWAESGDGWGNRRAGALALGPAAAVLLVAAVLTYRSSI